MKQRERSFYTTEPFFRENLGYYIHWHDENLGRLKRGKKGDITKYFITQRKKMKEAAGKALKTQYKYLTHSIIDQKDAKSLAFASKIVGKGTVSDDIVTAIDKVVKEQLVKRINDETIKASLITGNEFHDYLKDNSLSGKLVADLEKAGNTLNQLLEGIAKVINTLKVKKNYKNFVLGLTAAEIQGVQSMNDLGVLFEAKVKELDKLSRSRSFFIDKEQIKILADSLNNITDWLKSQNKKNSNDFTYNILKSLFDTEISPIGIGEAFGFYNKRMAQEALGQTITDSIKYIGKEEYPIVFSDPSGQYPKKSSTSDNTTGDKQGKADMKFKNLQIEIKKQKGIKQDYTLIISVGISNKLYLNNANINEDENGQKIIKKQLTKSVKVSKGIPLGDAIKSTFHQERLIYLAYNTFAWQTESSEAKLAVEPLQDIIFTRNLVHVMAARSGEDFASYILMNGQLFSVWDIIQYAINNDIGALTKDQQATGPKGIKYSWDPDKKKGIQQDDVVQYVRQRNSISMEKRIKQSNDIINKTKFYVYLNPNSLTI